MYVYIYIPFVYLTEPWKMDEHGPFIDGYLLKIVVSMAMLNNQMVYIYIYTY